MKTICLINRKGGVGKSSSCHHFSGALAKAGRRVLLVDNDPQSSLTQGFFGPEAARSVAPSESVAALYEPDSDPVPESLIVPTAFPGVSIVRGSLALDEWNMTPRRDWGPSRDGLGRFLRSLRGEYDLCLVDCPPNLHLCSVAALAGSDGVVVPLQAEDYGAQGVHGISEAIDAARAGDNPGLAMLGFLITMFDKRLAIHLSYREMLRDLYPGEVFENVIPRAKDYVEAVAARMPVTSYKPRSAAARAVEAAAGELESRAARAGGVGTERTAA